VGEPSFQQLRLDLSREPTREAEFRGGQPDGGSRVPFDERSLVELLATRVYELLAQRGHEDSQARTRDLLDAAEVARILGCGRGWVYEHKAELGVVGLGDGPRPRLRFPRARVEEIVGSAALGGRSSDRSALRLPRTARRAAAPLIEIKGRAP
jgi:hypothetical protein